MVKPYLKFTGNFKQLRCMGFSLEKLFADNRLVWSYENMKNLDYTRIWVTDRIVTVDELTNYEGYFFEQFLLHQKENKPLDFQHLDGQMYIRYVQNLETDRILLLPNFINNCDPLLWAVKNININSLKGIGELYRMGFIEIEYK